MFPIQFILTANADFKWRINSKLFGSYRFIFLNVGVCLFNLKLTIASAIPTLNDWNMSTSTFVIVLQNWHKMFICSCIQLLSDIIMSITPIVPNDIAWLVPGIFFKFLLEIVHSQRLVITGMLEAVWRVPDQTDRATRWETQHDESFAPT